MIAKKVWKFDPVPPNFNPESLKPVYNCKNCGARVVVEEQNWMHYPWYGVACHALPGVELKGNVQRASPKGPPVGFLFKDRYLTREDVAGYINALVEAYQTESDYLLEWMRNVDKKCTR